jgi:hypothetical protein
MGAVTAGIYGGGPIYQGGTGSIDDLRASGFTTVVAWSVWVSAEGDLNLNMNQQLTEGGEYWAGPDFADLMARLKQSPTSVTRLLFSVGSSEAATWEAIQSLVKSQGTGPDSALYRSFAALKQAIPGIDGIDFDDESVYDPKTTVPFAQMLHGLGYEVTFCPFDYLGELDFWTGCLAELNVQDAPPVVTAFNLQCYAGGAGNDPQEWIAAIEGIMPKGYDAAALVQPGLWCVHDDGSGGTCNEGDCPTAIESTFAAWKPTGIGGGWIWLLDDVRKCERSGACSGAAIGTAAYAKAIVQALG